LVGREDEVALSLLLALEDDAVAGADDVVVDVEGASYLDLYARISAIPLASVRR